VLKLHKRGENVKILLFIFGFIFLSFWITFLIAVGVKAALRSWENDKTK
jgi:hypothetical protein